MITLPGLFCAALEMNIGTPKIQGLEGWFSDVPSVSFRGRVPFLPFVHGSVVKWPWFQRKKRRSSWHSSVEKPWKFKIDSKNGHIEKEITFFQLTALKSSPPNLLDNGSQTRKTWCDRSVSEFISHLALGTYVKFNCSPPDKGSTCPKKETKVCKHHFSGPFAVHLRGSFFDRKGLDSPKKAEK